jgi:hypothetical protein
MPFITHTAITITATKDDDCACFLKEAAIMAQFSHAHIVSLIGVCLEPCTEPTLIVLEYLSLGSLHGCAENCDISTTLTLVSPHPLFVGALFQTLSLDFSPLTRLAIFRARWCRVSWSHTQ